MTPEQKGLNPSGAIHDGQMRDVLRGWFAIHAEDKGLSMDGESTKEGFLFYSMDTKAAFEHFIYGYMAGRADAIKEALA